MLDLNYLFLAFLLFSILFQLVYLPPNQLAIFRGKTKLNRILSDNKHSFSLVHLKQTQNNPSAQPYLFVHGHKGNVKQAISMAVYFNTHTELNMYSIDFSEGAVALSYDLLQAEVNFTAHCINEVQKIHEGKPVIIIGHSYGGVVAGMALKNIEKEKVKGIISLASPFESPVVNSDIRIMRAYDDMYKNLKETDMFLISITGGIRDQTVPSQLTKFPLTKNYLHIYSTSIKGFHKEIDHVALVWGEEFFKVFLEVLKIAPNLSNEALISEVKKMFTCDLSLMTNGITREKTWKFVKVSEKEELQLQKGLRLNDEFYYILPSDSKLDLPKSSLIQEIDLKKIPRFSLTNLLFGIKIAVKAGDLGSIIFTSGDFAESRYPLHIRVLGEGQVQAIIARCGSEEIVKYNENDFVLYFHEKCENGQEIWMIGHDEEFEYRVSVWIDFGGMIVSMMRDFRIHMFAAFFYFSLSEQLNERLKDSRNAKSVFLRTFGVHRSLMATHFSIALVLLIFGNVFKNVGLSLVFDNMSNTDVEYGVLDLTFIVITGLGLKCFFDLVFNLFEVIRNFTSRLDKFRVFLVPFFYFFPWPALLFLLLIKSAKTQSLKLTYLAFLSLLPQQIDWYLTYIEYNINTPNFLVICPALFLMTSDLLKPDLALESFAFSVICALFVHDHLFKLVWMFQAITLYGALKSLIFRKSIY